MSPSNGVSMVSARKNPVLNASGVMVVVEVEVVEEELVDVEVLVLVVVELVSVGGEVVVLLDEELLVELDDDELVLVEVEVEVVEVRLVDSSRIIWSPSSFKR